LKLEISILGCGWLGLPLASYLVNMGIVVKGSVTSLDKLEKLISKNIIPYIVDINTEGNDLSDFLHSEILIISIPSKIFNNFKSLIGHIEVSKIKKVLFISSTSVYSNSNQIVTEETQVKDSLLSEIEILFRSSPLFETSIIRFGGLFGYDRKPGNFITKVKKIENPEGFVNLIHRDDCIQIIHQIVINDIWGEIFNACADTHPSRRDFYTKENLKLGREELIFNENALNSYKIISSNKLKSMLGFTFKYSDLLNYHE